MSQGWMSVLYIQRGEVSALAGALEDLCGFILGTRKQFVCCMIEGKHGQRLHFFPTLERTKCVALQRIYSEFELYTAD